TSALRQSVAAKPELALQAMLGAARVPHGLVGSFERPSLVICREPRIAAELQRRDIARARIGRRTHQHGGARHFGVKRRRLIRLAVAEPVLCEHAMSGADELAVHELSAPRELLLLTTRRGCSERAKAQRTLARTRRVRRERQRAKRVAHI